MATAQFLGQKNGILVVVGVDHIGLHGDIPFCMEDEGRQRDQRSEGFCPEILHLFTHVSSIHPSFCPPILCICSFIYSSIFTLSLSTHLLHRFVIYSSTIISSVRPLCISAHKYIHFPSFLPSLFPSCFPPSVNPSVYVFND